MEVGPPDSDVLHACVERLLRERVIRKFGGYGRFEEPPRLVPWAVGPAFVAMEGEGGGEWGEGDVVTTVDVLNNQEDKLREMQLALDARLRMDGEMRKGDAQRRCASEWVPRHVIQFFCFTTTPSCRTNPQPCSPPG